ncbi:4'-phosphopantetheinyl transferase superfamily protein [Arthrobacter sp.]|uniref:4'-phosphopantetheinyl transferase family protein n=1 Tax=Arthrobacter sp. TaxID=1667 RepID=UPI002899F3DB|nr:4'-phosphopantetheinyl transferase superfamily protein [Arthrobacter sp.]
MNTRTGTEARTASVLLSLAVRRLGEPDPDEAPLTPAELRRASTFADPAVRRRYVASRQAARQFVAALAGVEPSAVAADYRCPECGPDAVHSHGVPQYRAGGGILPFLVSFSRSGDWLLAGATATAALGLDLAHLAGFGDPGLDAVISTDSEHTQFDADAPGSRALRQARQWTRKEAVLKATGAGLRIAPHLVEVSAGRTATVLTTGQRLQVLDLDAGMLGLPDGLLAAAAVSGPGAVRVDRISWD